MSSHSPNSKPNAPRRHLGGFGIVELLVAATIISIIAAAGFTLFLNIEQSVHNVRVATKNVVEGRIASDRLWLDFQDDAAFFNSNLVDYPQDLPATPDDNETKLFLHPAMRGNSVYDARRSFNCRVNSVTGSDLLIPQSCSPVTGAAQIAEFFDNLTHPTLPSVVLVESKAPCVIKSTDTSSIPFTAVLTVADPECFKQDNGSEVRLDSGVVLPRMRYSSISGSELVSGVVFDHINFQREGAGLSFGFVPEWRQTDSSVYVAQAVPGPALNSAFLRIDNISDAGFLRLFNPIQQSPLALRVISPNSELRLNGPPSVDELFADNLTADNVSTFLQNLRVRSSTADNITLDITLSSDDISWKRRLIIVD